LKCHSFTVKSQLISVLNLSAILFQWKNSVREGERGEGEEGGEGREEGGEEEGGGGRREGRKSEGRLQVLLLF